MKHIFFGMTMFILLCVIIVSIQSISGRTQRDAEAKDALDTAMKETIETLSSKGTYYPEDSEDLMADFVELFANNINASGKVKHLTAMDGSDETVQIEEYDDPDKSKTVFQFNFYKADYEDGLLSAKVKEKITYPGGKQSLIEASGVVIMEEEDPKESYTVTYLLPEDTMLKNFGYQTLQRYSGEGMSDGNDVSKAADTPVPYDDYGIYRKYIAVEDSVIQVPDTKPTTKNVEGAAEITSWKVIYAGDLSTDIGKDNQDGVDVNQSYTPEQLAKKKITRDIVLVPAAS